MQFKIFELGKIEMIKKGFQKEPMLALRRCNFNQLITMIILRFLIYSVATQLVALIHNLGTYSLRDRQNVTVLSVSDFPASDILQILQTVLDELPISKNMLAFQLRPYLAEMVHVQLPHE